MTEIIVNSAQQSEFKDTVSFLLEKVGMDRKTAAQYDDFLLATENRYIPINQGIKHASIALGRLYFCSMKGKHSDTLRYEPGEQMMLSLMTGRTIREDPIPITVASIDYAQSHGQSELIARQCVELAFSGVQKLRKRSEERPALFKEAKHAIGVSNNKFKLF